MTTKKQIGRLQELFENDLNLFLNFYHRDDGEAIKFGFDTLTDLWNSNPTVETITN